MKGNLSGGRQQRQQGVESDELDAQQQQAAFTALSCVSASDWLKLEDQRAMWHLHSSRIRRQGRGTEQHPVNRVSSIALKTT